MKLKTPEIEFIKFDTEDIITTSGHNVDETTVGVIYLSRESISNFNKLYANDINLITTKYQYAAYTGVKGYLEDFDITFYQSAYECNTLDESQRKALRIVDEGDISDYNEVLLWLQSHGSAQ